MATSITVDDLARSPELLAALVELNNQHAIELSWADAARISQLVDRSFSTLRAGFADALLIAFDQDTDYDNDNFRWFSSRYDNFVYIDRVVTAATARNRGLARALYDALIELAVEAGHERIVCEINSDPPNPGSEAFHRKLGFQAVGGAILSNGKTVEYQELKLSQS